MPTAGLEILPRFDCFMVGERPRSYYLQVITGQSRLAMHPHILLRRHNVILDSCLDRGCEAPLFVLGKTVPLGYIHECTAPLHIRVNLPGNRREVRVPGPGRVIGMTILTGAF